MFILPPEGGEELDEDQDDGRDAVDGERKEERTTSIRRSDTAVRPGEEMRHWYITRGIVRDYGRTQGCPGCESE